MKKSTQTIRENQNESKIGSGALAGIAVLAAAATAGAYFLYGSKNAVKNRHQVKSWVVKAKGDVLEHLENLKELNEEAYHTAVNNVINHYKRLKNVDPAELMALKESFISHWKDIKAEIDATLKKSESDISSGMKKASGEVKKVAKSTKKTVKKAVKKITSQEK